MSTKQPHSGGFTPEQVGRAAKVFVRFPRGVRMYWDPLSDLSIEERRKLARAVLSAAGAPEKPAPVVDEAALTEALERHVVGEPNGRGVASSAWCLCSCGYRAERVGMSRNYVRALALSHQATAVAAYLRGESK